VVDLAEDRRAAAGHARHDEDLPQRARAVQRRRQERVRGSAQVAPVELALVGQLADVVVEVEAGVVGPHRLGHAERDRDHALAEARHMGEPRGDARAEHGGVEARHARRAVDDREPADVHVRGRALDAEERGVDRRQAIHADHDRAGGAPRPPAAGRNPPGPPV
jgi:hypothetical protein